MPKKLTPQQAKAMLIADGMDFTQDFHVLGSAAVQALADTAKRAGYRKSKTAPGSTARMFYQYLSRVAPVVRAAGELTPAERRAYQARARKATHHSTVKTPTQLNREVHRALVLKLKQGAKVIANGYPGSVVRVTPYKMVEVRLPGGVTCVSAEDVTIPGVSQGNA